MLLLVHTAGAVTLSLPDLPDAPSWAEAAQRAGFTLVTSDGDVRVDVHDDAWWLLARRDPCTAYAYAPATTAEARDALLAAARVLAGDEPLPSFEEEPAATLPPPPEPAAACPDGPRVVPARPTAPPDRPVAAPLVWRPVPPSPGPARPHRLPPAEGGGSPPLLALLALRARPDDAVVVRVGLMRPWADLAGAAGLRAGAAVRAAGIWSLGVELELDTPAWFSPAYDVTLTRQYLGVRAAVGRGVRAALSAGASVVELDGPDPRFTVLWEPRLALDGEVCTDAWAEVCAWGGVGAELFPVRLYDHGVERRTTSPLLLRVGLSVEVPVARSPWRPA